MKDFNYWKTRYENQQLEEFNTDRIGLLWLKIKSICRVDLLKWFIDNYYFFYINQNLKLEDKFEALFLLLCKNVERSHEILDFYIKQQYRSEVKEYPLDVNELVSELYKLKNFDWGGDYRNSLDKFLISRYIKIPHNYRLLPNYAPAFSYDFLISRFDSEINSAVRGYVLNSWYNHWSSILIENIFKSHSSILPAIGQIKSVDFFINSIPFDLKVTYLPAEYIKLKRKEMQLPVELTFLKNKAIEAGIYFDKKAKDVDIYHEITERMNDKADEFCRSVLATLKNEKLQILKDAQNNPKMLATWLYENQGEMRFGSENRLFLVLVDSDDFNNSWKLKRNIDLLKPTITEYLDNFNSKKIQDLKVSFSYKGKSQTFTALADVIFVVK
jgi:hypothetical protein